jgi:hypothetical protein
MGTDPSGLATEAQFADLIYKATQAYLTHGNRTRLGMAGELVMERALTRSGYRILQGPATLPSQHNADIIAYDPETKRLLFIDNKILTSSETIRSASTLIDDARLKSLDVSRQNLVQLLRTGEMTTSEAGEIMSALRRTRTDTGLADWLVTLASPEDVKNLARRVSVRLARKGERVAEIDDDRLKVRGLEGSMDGVRGARKLLRSIGRAAPAIGTGVTIAQGSSRVDAAVSDDVDYATMCYLGGQEPLFPNQTLARELTMIAGEEAWGEVGAWGGVALGSLGGPWCAAGVGVAGGLIGDYLGSTGAASAFDEMYSVSPEMMDWIARSAK